MYRAFLPVAIGALLASSIALGQTQANAPAPAPASGSMHAVCRDGTTFSGATLKGACRGHGGIDRNASSKGAKAASGTAAMPPMASPAASAAGGGAAKVWVNNPTKVYHCPGDRYYGKTKDGTYMSEAEAKAKGARPDHGKACQ